MANAVILGRGELHRELTSPDAHPTADFPPMMTPRRVAPLLADAGNVAAGVDAAASQDGSPANDPVPPSDGARERARTLPPGAFGAGGIAV